MVKACLNVVDEAKEVHAPLLGCIGVAPISQPQHDYSENPIIHLVKEWERLLRVVVFWKLSELHSARSERLVERDDCFEVEQS